MGAIKYSNTIIIDSPIESVLEEVKKNIKKGIIPDTI